MSFIRITKSNTDTAYVRLHPSRSFSSSSSGVTGSVRVIAQSSPFFKEVSKTNPFVDSPLEASSVEAFRETVWLETADADKTPYPASGSLTGSTTSGITGGLTLTFKDGSGNSYLASTDVSKTKVQSTATAIGINGVSTTTDLIESVYTSIFEATAFGVTSTVKSTPSGDKLKLDGLSSPPSDKLPLQLIDVGYQGNNPITGSLVGVTPPFITVRGLSGGVGTSAQPLFDGYMDKVRQQSQAARQSKYVEVLRFAPTNTLTSDTQRKSTYRKVLLPFYKTSQPDTGFNFTNYQCFNFISSSQFPSASALVYPEPLDQYAVHTGFTFSFNVKANRDAGNDENGVAWNYNAGCVMFRSSSYSVSIITGSKKTEKGNPLAYRVLLQLSGAVDTDPSTVDTSSLPSFTFVSSDNVLKKNHWHNVAISWGKDHNAGTGSFFIDGVHDSTADFTLGTININTGSDQSSNDYGVIIGARFNADNSQMSGFFNSNVSKEGVWNGGAGTEPHNSASVNRLNAEIHDLRIHSNVIAPDQVSTGSSTGIASAPKGMVFYVPGFFIKESPKRLSLITPFQQETTGTQEPFNVKLNYGVDGRDINLQNYVREFVQKSNPRLSYLTASTINTSTETYSANAFLLDVGANKLMHRARGMFLLPCDNGKFFPAWSLLHSGTDVTSSVYPTSNSPMSKFVNDFGALNYSIVSLKNMISTASILEGLLQVNTNGSDNTDKNGLLQQIMGSSPEDVSVDPGSGYTILQRTRDNSSNLVVFFDASNLFYGNRIEPSTFSVSETNISGTSDSLSMKFSDNGRGGLYRADSSSIHATFARVGDILYDEGISGIMHPCIPFFGKNSFSVDMKGDQNIHVYEVNVPALAGMLNSSSNPRYVAGTKDDYASSTDGAALGVSSILFHDENFNVIARTTLSQPILKTEFDKYLFRVKFDF